MEWILCSEKIPDIVDDSVLAFFPQNGSVEMVHIMDFFSDITNGIDEKGNQLYTKWYLTVGVTHWMPLPNPPEIDG